MALLIGISNGFGGHFFAERLFRDHGDFQVLGGREFYQGVLHEVSAAPFWISGNFFTVF